MGAESNLFAKLVSVYPMAWLTAAGGAVEGISLLGPAQVRMLLRAMEEAVVASGKAKPGDKTMLDALHAATRGQDQDRPAVDVCSG